MIRCSVVHWLNVFYIVAACISAATAAPGITRTILLDPLDETTIALPDSFVILDSFRVESDSMPVEPGREGFSVHAFRSEISLSPIHLGKTVGITYRYLPLGIGRRFQNRVRPSPYEPLLIEKTPTDAPIAYDTDLSGERNIAIAGTKTIGVRAGSQQDPTLNQSLTVQLVGRIAGDIEVNARLSDENSPIQPEGTSAQLKDLDEIVIDLKRKDDRLSIGDCSIRFTDFQFLKLERKMQGLSGSVVHRGWESSFALASSKGEFASIEFSGREGKQGPYYLGDQLRSAGGISDIIILAGTERVWIDGVQVSRGTDRDYTIDYATGALIFTEHHLITDQTRIAVDFQYSSERYNRSIYTATVSGSLADLISLKTGWFSERDDENATPGWDLSDTERTALERAGDDPEAAAIPSYRYVGFGNGVYDTLHVRYFIPDEAGTWNVIFESAEEGKGSYRAMDSGYEYYGPQGGDYVARPESTGVGSYTAVRDIILVSDYRKRRREEGTISSDFDQGESVRLTGTFTATFYRRPEGDYIRESQSLWRYVGPGHGDYTLYRQVPVPRSQDTFVAGVAIHSGDLLSLSVEGATIRKDANTLSDLDDDDNSAGAIAADIALSGTGNFLVPTWRLQGRFKGQDQGFSSPGRLKPVDWSRSWSVEGVENAAQHEASVDMFLGLPDQGTIDVSLGELTSGARTDRRVTVQTDIRAPYGFMVRGRYNRSTERGDGDLRWWTEGTVSRSGGIVGPLFKWKAETTESRTPLPGRTYRGEGYREMGYGLRMGGEGSHVISFIGGIRRNRILGNANSIWYDSRTGTWIEVEGSGGTGRRFRASLDFKFANSKPSTTVEEPSALDSQREVRNAVGSIRMTTDPGGGWPSFDVVYAASGREQEILTERLVPEESFETNVGEYDSLGNWVGVETGTHKKVLEPSGSGEQVANVQASLVMRLKPGSSSSNLFRRMISSDTSVRIQVDSRAVDRYGLYLLDPKILGNDSLSLNERVRVEERIELRPAHHSFRIGLQWIYNFSTDNRRIDRKLRDTSNQSLIRIRGSGPFRGNLELRMSRTRDEEVEEYRDGQSSSLENTSVKYAVEPAYSLPLWRHVEGLVSVDIGRESIHQRQGQSVERDAVISELALTPGIRYSFPNRGNIRIESGLRNTRISGPWDQMSGLLRRRDESGSAIDIRVTGTYRLQKSLLLNLNVLYGKTPLQGEVQEGSMELVATF